MKSWLIIISLLLSSFMIHEARGMSLRRGSLLDHYKSDDIIGKIVPLDDQGLTSNIVDHQVKEKFSGRSRKLIVSPTSSSTTQTAKNHVKMNEEDKAHHSNTKGSSNKEKKEEKISVNSSTQRQEVYPDVMDIAGMDYSQARRRPPIHN
ncbi:uncharacterized protein [Henckelia pumila]|uniref:uncharacterized protein n=1 Tax=Henckelia pumila TaxID=405737 RepID=UPI003C6E398A